jgi:hypothetical protein
MRASTRDSVDRLDRMHMTDHLSTCCGKGEREWLPAAASASQTLVRPVGALGNLIRSPKLRHKTHSASCCPGQSRRYRIVSPLNPPTIASADNLIDLWADCPPSSIPLL